MALVVEVGAAYSTAIVTVMYSDAEPLRSLAL